MTLIVRADGGIRMGTGHVMRSLALAQAWQAAGGRAVAAMALSTPALTARVQREGVEVINLPVEPGSLEDARQTASLARERGASWVAGDGYHFGSLFQGFLKDAGLRLLLIDDNGQDWRWLADILVNHNIHAHEDLYPWREPYTRMLLGPRHALLRREFWPWRDWEREITRKAHRLLLTLGGSDPDNLSAQVLRALETLNAPMQVKVVVGGANPHLRELEEAGGASHPVELCRDVTNMPELMAWADLAISGGGATVLELAFMGLPLLTLIMAENQRLQAERLGELGITVNLGWPGNLASSQIARTIEVLLADERARTKMARRGRELVDGRGGERVAQAMMGSP